MSGDVWTPDVRTHQAIERSLSGTPVAVTDGRATLRLQTTRAMVADDRGLVHGGFIFSLADHAAMLAVNDPPGGLGAAQVTFLWPVRVGQEVDAQAEVGEVKGKKRVVSVTASVVGESGSTADGPVFEGEFVCLVLERHVLE